MITPEIKYTYLTDLCARVLSHFNLVLLFATLWAVEGWALLSMGFSRKEYWSALPCPPPGDLPNPGIKSVFPALQVDPIALNHWGNPLTDLCCCCC